MLEDQKYKLEYLLNIFRSSVIEMDLTDSEIVHIFNTDSALPLIGINYKGFMELKADRKGRILQFVELVQVISEDEICRVTCLSGDLSRSGALKDDLAVWARTPLPGLGSNLDMGYETAKKNRAHSRRSAMSPIGAMATTARYCQAGLSEWVSFGATKSPKSAGPAILLEYLRPKILKIAA